METKSILDHEKLKQIAKEKSSVYQNAKPFSHVVIDHLFDDRILDVVLKDFPTVTSINWTKFKTPMENNKFASDKYELIPDNIRYVLDQLNSATFINFLEELTGIKGLIADPHYVGGGMHQTVRGGSLGIHVDFNKHSLFNLYRRINVLLYLNKDWKEEWGGSLELWDHKVQKCYEKVLPVYNRLAIFTTSEGSQHGYPDPLTCPKEETRKSLAWYYYTVDKPDNIDGELHTTIYTKRPGKDSNYSMQKVKDFLRELTPPIIYKIYLKLK